MINLQRRAIGPWALGNVTQGVMELCGYNCLYDPPREDSAFTIKTAQAMGVEVKMVTGDHLAIAQKSQGSQPRD